MSNEDEDILAGCGLAGCGILFIVAIVIVTVLGLIALLGWAWRLLG